jgi:hypothetical protein
MEYFDVDDLYSDMNDEEIRGLIAIFEKNGYLPSLKNSFEKINYDTEFFIKSLNKLEINYYSLSRDEEEIINNLAKRF